jgi:hypothetical protein
MNNLPAVKKETFDFMVPDSYERAKEIAEGLAKSKMVPQHYQNNPTDIVIAMSYGAQLGLSPVIALNGIAVINGAPSIWGNTFWGLVLSAPEVVDVKEEWNEEKKEWTVTIWRRDIKHPFVGQFGLNDASKAGLLSDPKKSFTWGKYPKDMARYKARSRAGRAAISDRLCGLGMYEDMRDSVDVSIVETPEEKPFEESKVKQLKADLQPSEGEQAQSPQTGIGAPESRPEAQEENSPEPQPPNSPSVTDEKKRKTRSDKGKSRKTEESKNNPVLQAIETAWYGQGCDGLSVTFKTETRDRLRIQGITFDEPKDLDDKGLEELYSVIEGLGGFEDNPPF